MKPILFNTEMVRAVMDDRKTVTRRVVKEPWYVDNEEACRFSGMAMHRGCDYTHGMPYSDRPYHPGEVLYVRETWRIWKAHRYDADATLSSRRAGMGPCSVSHMDVPILPTGRTMTILPRNGALVANGAPPSICPRRRQGCF